MNLVIEIAQDYKKWSNHSKINKKLIKLITKKIIIKHKIFSQIQNIELSILLTNCNNIKFLNKKFRQKEEDTNVLSFPNIEIYSKHMLALPINKDYIFLGDIAFSYQKIYTESNKNSISFINHFKHLLVHGILHLLGYNHLEDKDAEIMQTMEIKILQNLNIPSPY